jgi:hypothetical protein
MEPKAPTINSHAARPVRTPVVSSGHAPSRRGKNASPAADRWPTFTFPARGDAVAVWGASAAFLSPSLIAPPRGRAVVTTGAHGSRIVLPCRPAGPAAPAPGRVPWTRQTSADLSVRSRGPTPSAQQEIGWSEAFAASSVPAFEWSRVTTGNSSRVTDVAASQRLLAARRQGASGSRFPPFD